MAFLANRYRAPDPTPNPGSCGYPVYRVCLTRRGKPQTLAKIGVSESRLTLAVHRSLRRPSKVLGVCSWLICACFALALIALLAAALFSRFKSPGQPAGTSKPPQRIQPAQNKAQTAADPVLKLQQDASARGDPDGQFRMGQRYLTGDGVERNVARAREMFEKAAAQGETQAVAALSKLTNAVSPVRPPVSVNAPR